MNRFCVDCKHFHRGQIGAWCHSPNRPIDLVHGSGRVMFAHAARRDEALCGPNAAWFENAEPKASVPWWKFWAK